MGKMAKATVGEHTRQLANGTQVTVHEHSRAFNPASSTDERRSPVEQHRRERVKAQARARREAALERGREAARRSGPFLRKTAKKSGAIAKKGGKRLQRAARYASRRRRVMAAACVVGGMAELGASLAWGVGGLIWAGVSILGAAVGGGLFLGGSKRSTAATDRPRKPAPTAARSPRAAGKKHAVESQGAATGGSDAMARWDRWGQQK